MLIWRLQNSDGTRLAGDQTPVSVYMDFIYRGCRLAIDFIAPTSLGTPRAHRAGHASRDLQPCMECSVENTDTAFGQAQEPVEVPGTQYTPGDFLRQFGSVIAICLGLALLANVLVTIVGEY